MLDPTRERPYRALLLSQRSPRARGGRLSHSPRHHTAQTHVPVARRASPLLPAPSHRNLATRLYKPFSGPQRSVRPSSFVLDPTRERPYRALLLSQRSPKSRKRWPPLPLTTAPHSPDARPSRSASFTAPPRPEPPKPRNAPVQAILRPSALSEALVLRARSNPRAPVQGPAADGRRLGRVVRRRLRGSAW